MTASNLHTLQQLFRSHPWHGVPSGDSAPEVINVFVEMGPSDTFKYEIDKESGILMVDRPQKFSSICPAMYGFLPQSYCAEKVAQLSQVVHNDVMVIGDGDPLDICVISERPIPHGNLLVCARPIGGFRMLDDNEADDKVVAVLQGDLAFGNITDISQCPKALIDRLHHYFVTYKRAPKDTESSCSIGEVYGREGAYEVIKASLEDYDVYYEGLREALTKSHQE